jgi:hypothetical protein
MNVSQFTPANAKIPEEALALMTLTELKKLIAEHGGTINPVAKREELYKFARRLVKDKLVQNDNENTVTNSLTRNTTYENASKPIGEVIAEELPKTFGTPATIVEITNTINPATAPSLGLTGIPDNALGLFGKAKQDLHEVIVLRPILKSFKLTPQNRQRISLYHSQLESNLLENYEGAIQQTLKVILANSTRKDIQRIQTVFTPERLVRFKAALLDIFVKSPVYANKIFDTLLWDILAREDVPGEVIDSILTRMQNAPFKTLDLMQTLSSSFTETITDLRKQKLIAGFRGLNTLKARVLATMVLAGLGGIVYLIIFWNASSPQGFVYVINHTLLPEVMQSEFMKEFQIFQEAVSKRVSESSIGETLKPVGEQLKTSYASLTDPVRPKSFFNTIRSAFSTKPTNSGELR